MVKYHGCSAPDPGLLLDRCPVLLLVDIRQAVGQSAFFRIHIGIADFHFISEDRKLGGPILQLSVKDARAAFDLGAKVYSSA